MGFEILAGHADAGPGFGGVAGLLNIVFIPIRWDRFDLMIIKDRFFDEGIQKFLGLLHEKEFKSLGDVISGYDLSASGKMIYPGESDRGQMTEKRGKR